MNIIILRGLPGCGKTAIAERLSPLINAHYINVDKYKLESNATSFREKCAYSYERTLNELKTLNSKNIIIDELFNDKVFVNSIIELAKLKKANVYCFQIKRPLEELMKVESERKRKIKNSIDDFKMLQKEIDSVELDENIIENKDLDLSVKQIRGYIDA